MLAPLIFLIVSATAQPSGSMAGRLQSAGADACPLIVRTEKNGTFITHRFSGWYKTTPALLESDLRGGCYNDSHPSPVTSVTLEIAAGSPPARIALLYRILDRNGWPKGKVTVKPRIGQTVTTH